MGWSRQGKAEVLCVSLVTAGMFGFEVWTRFAKNDFDWKMILFALIALGASVLFLRLLPGVLFDSDKEEKPDL